MATVANDHSNPPASRHFEYSFRQMKQQAQKPNQLKELLKLRDKDGNMALHLAAKQGNEELVGLLLDAGSPVDAENRFGWTALHFAAEGVDGQVVERLLEAGANVDNSDHEQSTPLNKAALYGNRDVVEKLLTANPDIEAVDWTGQAALHSAAIRGNDERSDAVLESLLANGAKVNTLTKDGYTPVHLAILVGNIEAVRIVAEHGANPSAKITSGVIKSQGRGCR
jgi:ankyrin repeat protein